jgi:hypothetical protein
VSPAFATDIEITAFRTVNQSPLVQVFEISADSSSVITDAGRLSVSFTQDLASEYTATRTRNEQITLDGESYRWTLTARYGIGDRFEAGIDIPYMLYGGSSLGQLSKSTLMLVTGGTLKLPGSYLLDIGVSEDVVVTTSPDVAFHLGLHKQF